MFASSRVVHTVLVIQNVHFTHCLSIWLVPSYVPRINGYTSFYLILVAFRNNSYYNTVLSHIEVVLLFRGILHVSGSFLLVYIIVKQFSNEDKIQILW